MANFNQQLQRVHHQINGEHIHVSAVAPPAAIDIEGMINELLRRLSSDHERTETNIAVIANLEAARDASSRGDTTGLYAFLVRAAEVAAPARVIATSIGAIIKLLLPGHD